jgi:SAM-dependent methyltransferase
VSSAGLREGATSLSPSQQMIQLSSGYIVSKTLSLVAQLGIADLLATGPRTSAALAAAAGVHAPSLYRVLRALAGLGVFVEEEAQTFRLAPLGATLRSDGADSVRNWVLLNGTIGWRSFGELRYAVQTGQTGFERAFGMPIFEYLARHPDDAAVFARTMIDFHGPEAAAVAAAYRFPDGGALVDLGGGLGNLLAALLAANPGLRGILVELPHVAEEATRRLDAAGLGGRCEVVRGSFFERVPTGGDVYLLSHVVHDWDEPSCLTLLGNCRRAIAPGGRLVIVETVLPGANQPSPGTLTDLIMLASQRGQERTEAEYRDLLAKAGFRLTRVVPTASAVSVIEAVPA